MNGDVRIFILSFIIDCENSFKFVVRAVLFRVDSRWFQIVALQFVIFQVSYYLIVAFIIQNLKTQMQSCPVMYPSAQEFADFYRYIHQLDQKFKNTYGMVKIVPPPNWTPQSKNYAQKLENLIVKNPIEQNVQGRGGFYESKNIVQNKMTFKAYRKYADSQNAKVEGKDNTEKQKIFWKTITYSAPIYGADLTGTLMDQNAQEWNFNHLNSLLRYSLTEKVKGVTEPYCYIGSWKAFFSWHKEDLDLAAINYIHEGSSKIWYSIAKADSHILQQEAKQFFKQQSRKCSQFLRHKTFLINPQILQKKHQQLKITRVEHRAGEIMIVFGGAYHCGFNCGFNIAEAVNYATIDWLKQLTEVRFCTCFKKSVRGEIESILYNLQNSEIYDELSKMEQFQALQNFVYDMQLREDNTFLECAHQCGNQNKSNENANTHNNIDPLVQVAPKTQLNVAKQKQSKKIKKDKNKKKKKIQEQYRPSSKCKIGISIQSKQPRQTTVDFLKDCKKITPGESQPIEVMQDGQELHLE